MQANLIKFTEAFNIRVELVFVLAMFCLGIQGKALKNDFRSRVRTEHLMK